MNILNNSNMHVIDFLGGFQRRVKNRTYRWNKDIISVEHDGMLILHNGITGATVSLFPFEYDNVFTTLPCDYSNFLFENYFLVKEDFDETQLIKDYRSKYRPYTTPNYLETLSHFTILSTTKCNARCAYCYENDLPGKHDMTIETAHDIAEYIIEHVNLNSQLSLEWFGGEPLTNPDVIDVITSKIRAAGINPFVKLVSNGYLFDDDMIKRANRIWGLNEVQITLDGYGEQYNKIKRYIYQDDPNPFETVIKNIHNLLEHGISVTIRLNCGVHNYKNLIELVNYLSEEFKGVNGFSIYAWEIFSNGPRPEDKAEVFFDCLDQVDEAICESGLITPNYVETGIKAGHCLVDNGNGAIINVDGKLCLCEHYLDGDSYGDIYNFGKWDYDHINNWRNYTNTYEGICSDCPNQAECLKMQKCTDQYVCTKAEQKYTLNKLKRRLILLYGAMFNNVCPDSQNNFKCCIQD